MHGSLGRLNRQNDQACMAALARSSPADAEPSLCSKYPHDSSSKGNSWEAADYSDGLHVVYKAVAFNRAYGSCKLYSIWRAVALQAVSMLYCVNKRKSNTDTKLHLKSNMRAGQGKVQQV